MLANILQTNKNLCDKKIFWFSKKEQYFDIECFLKKADCFSKKIEKRLNSGSMVEF